jgi:hypothetical protein
MILFITTAVKTSNSIQDEVVWTGLFWLRIVTSGRALMNTAINLRIL